MVTQHNAHKAMGKATRHYTQQSVKPSRHTSVSRLSLVTRRYMDLRPRSVLNEKEIGH